MISRQTAEELHKIHVRIDEAKYMLKKLEEFEAAKLIDSGTIEYQGMKVSLVPFSVVKEMLLKLIKLNETELELLEFQVLEDLKN